MSEHRTVQLTKCSAAFGDHQSMSILGPMAFLWAVCKKSLDSHFTLYSEYYLVVHSGKTNCAIQQVVN